MSIEIQWTNQKVGNALSEDEDLMKDENRSNVSSVRSEPNILYLALFSGPL